MSELKSSGIRVALDDSDKSLGKKIALAVSSKYPYIGIIGKDEESSNSITLKSRVGEQTSYKMPDLIRKLQLEIDQKRQA